MIHNTVNFFFFLNIQECEAKGIREKSPWSPCVLDTRPCKVPQTSERVNVGVRVCQEDFGEDSAEVPNCPAAAQSSKKRSTEPIEQQVATRSSRAVTSGAQLIKAKPGSVYWGSFAY